MNESRPEFKCVSLARTRLDVMIVTDIIYATAFPEIFRSWNVGISSGPSTVRTVWAMCFVENASKEYLCPECFAAGNYFRCEECSAINCFDYGCAHLLEVCAGCDGEKCTSCIAAAGETDMPGYPLCPVCTATEDQD